MTLADFHPYEDAIFTIIGMVIAGFVTWRTMLHQLPARGRDGKFVSRETYYD